MSGPWIRVPPERVDRARALLGAGALAAGVGIVAYYLARVMLARERLGEAGPPGERADRGADGGGGA